MEHHVLKKRFIIKTSLRFIISFWPEERSLLKTFLRFIVKAYFMEHPSAGIVKFLRCLQMSYMLLVEWKEVNLKTSHFHL